MAKQTSVQQALIATLEAEGFSVTKTAAAPQPKAAAKKTQKTTSAKPSTRKSSAPKEDTMTKADQTELFELFMQFIATKTQVDEAPKATPTKIAPKGRKAPTTKAGRRHIKSGRLFEAPISLLRKGQVFQLSAKGAQYKVVSNVASGDKRLVVTDHPKLDGKAMTFGRGRTVLLVK